MSKNRSQANRATVVAIARYFTAGEYRISLTQNGTESLRGATRVAASENGNIP